MLQFARQLQEWTEQDRSKRQSVTSCPGSGSFACRLLWFSPYCRTPSVGGGRSAVSRSRPEPLHPNPGRSVGPGFLARRMRSKRCVFKLVCDFVLDRLTVVFCTAVFWLTAGSNAGVFKNTWLGLTEDGFQSKCQQRK